MSDGPKKRNGKNTGKGNKPEFYGTFVRCELSTEDKRALAQRELDPGRVFDQLDALVESGYKFSVGLQSDQTAYIASLFDRDEESKTKGYTLTGRGRSFSNAIAALLYKHYDLLDGIWPTGKPDDDEWA